MTDIDTTIANTCSALSTAAREPLYGTVKHTTHWLLLEYAGRWEAQAVPGSTLSAEVKQHLADFTTRVPHARVLLIRQKPRLHTGGHALFVVRSTPHDVQTHAFDLGAYDDLRDLDLPAIARGDQTYAVARRESPLTLVCTHGRRDQCCARHGIAVYEQWAALDGAQVWQASHVGGHRFAANVLLLPEGIMYGRVAPATVPALRAAREAQQLALTHYRGRSAVPPAAHAAEVFLRQATGNTDQAAFALSDVRVVDDQTHVVWREVATNAQHTLIVAQQSLNHPLPKSCGTDAAVLPRWALVSHARA